MAIGQAALLISRTLADDDPSTQLRIFESALRQFGVGAGMDAFDRLIRSCFDHIVKEGRVDDAKRVIRLTRRLVPASLGSQFAQEVIALENSI